MRPGEVNMEDKMTFWIEGTSTHTSISKQLCLFTRTYLYIYTVVLYIYTYIYILKYINYKTRTAIRQLVTGAEGRCSDLGRKWWWHWWHQCPGAPSGGVVTAKVATFYFGQILATSAKVTLNGGLVRESPQDPLNSGFRNYTNLPSFIVDDHGLLLISWKTPEKKKKIEPYRLTGFSWQIWFLVEGLDIPRVEIWLHDRSEMEAWNIKWNT